MPSKKKGKKGKGKKKSSSSSSTSAALTSAAIVGFDDFIRGVRRLARKQFFDKMRAAKIVAKRSPDRGVYRQSF